MLVIKKPTVKKTMSATIDQAITIDNIITGLSENSNEVVLSVLTKTKVATYDAQTNSVKMVAKGKVKITVTIINDQAKSVRYSCTIKIK